MFRVNHDDDMVRGVREEGEHGGQSNNIEQHWCEWGVIVARSVYKFISISYQKWSFIMKKLP